MFRVHAFTSQPDLEVTFNCQICKLQSTFSDINDVDTVSYHRIWQVGAAIPAKISKNIELWYIGL